MQQCSARAPGCSPAHSNLSSPVTFLNWCSLAPRHSSHTKHSPCRASLTLQTCRTAACLIIECYVANAWRAQTCLEPVLAYCPRDKEQSATGTQLQPCMSRPVSLQEVPEPWPQTPSTSPATIIGTGFMGCLFKHRLHHHCFILCYQQQSDQEGEEPSEAGGGDEGDDTMEEDRDDKVCVGFDDWQS